LARSGLRLGLGGRFGYVASWGYSSRVPKSGVLSLRWGGRYEATVITGVGYYSDKGGVPAISGVFLKDGDQVVGSWSMSNPVQAGLHTWYDCKYGHGHSR
jgi:hypothetical protein